MTNNKFASALKAHTPAPKPPQPAPAPSKSSGKRKHIGGYFAPEIGKRLRMLASEEETTTQDLLSEALQLLFQSRGKTLS